MQAGRKVAAREAVSGCQFCRALEGELPVPVVWDAEYAMAYLDGAPESLGHLLIVSRRHVPVRQVRTAWRIGSGMQPLFDAALLLAQPLQRATGAGRVGLEVEGETGGHLRLRLIPGGVGARADGGEAGGAHVEVLVEMSRRIWEQVPSR
jgi:diadenosine tetraphosphate (Ap4A) HIT family hydrolase